MNEPNIGNWQRRLEETFIYRGIVGGRILPSVMEQERICGAYLVDKFRGHRILADSFLDFFALTLRSAAAGHYEKGWPGHPYYIPCLLEFVTQFRGMRAAEILSLNGYPLDGYALQRNLKDQAIFIGSIVSDISSFPSLYGLKGPPISNPWTEKEQKLVFHHRKEEEKRIFSQMMGEDSGLVKSISRHLDVGAACSTCSYMALVSRPVWKCMLGFETKRSLLSVLDWMTTGAQCI
jgi:hypothetical protein